MATEMLPVVDLRALSQSDLDALAAASAHAVAPRSCPDADPLPPHKIDRAVFNESAGSRKQTFSRLRLAAASSSSASAHPTSPSSAPPSSARNDPDSRLVAYHLRLLFAPDDPSLPPPPEPQTLALTETSPSPPRSPPPDPDRETTNSKGISVDLVRLAGMVDPYDAELRRRTAGMVSETELFGFIASVAGQWVSQRRRRKFVDASFFGDHLPRCWKLQLGLKRKERTAWVHCFSYVSPKGNQFSTCKEVSAYLMSLLGYPEAKTVTIQYDSTSEHHLCANAGDDNALGSQHQIGSSVDNPNVVPVASDTFSSYASDSQDKNVKNVDILNAYECRKCNLTFCDRSAYAQHHLSSHEMSAKRRKTGKFGEPVVGKDGKFECPICHKNFAEESRYFGHVGAHARYQELTPEALLDKACSGKVVSDSLAEISFSLQELTESPGQNNKISAGEAGFQHHNRSNEHGCNNSEVTELFSANCSDNFIRPIEAWRRPEEIHLITDAPSVCGYTNDILVRCDVTVPKTASNSNDQPDGSINGFAEVTVFNDQVGSDHVFRPTTLRNANHYENQIIDHGMTAPKQISNTVKARDVNLNSSLDTISFPIASANNETSAAHNEANRSSFSAKCITGSFNNNDGSSSVSSCSGSTYKISSSLGTANKTSIASSRCFSASYGNDNGAVEASIFGNKNNAVVYQSDLGKRPVSPVATKADCFVSSSVQSKNSDKERASNTKERMDNMTNRTSNEVGFGAEAYNNDIFTGGVTERGFAQFNNSFTHIKPNASSHGSLPEYNIMTASNLIKGSDFNCMKGSSVNRSDINSTKGSFVNRPIGNNEPNVPMHEANFGTMSSVVQSVGDVPMSSTTQDQCDLHLGFGAHKQQIFSSQGEVTSAAAGSPQLGSIAKNNSLPTGSSQFGSMARPRSFPTGSPQFGSFARPNLVPAASSQFGSMASPNSVPPAGSSQFGSMARPNSVPPAGSSQFGSMVRPNSVPPVTSSQFGCTAQPNSIAPAESSQFGSMARPSSVPPAKSSQFGSMAGPNSVTPAVSSQFGKMPSQNFVSTPEPTLVLGYAPQMGSGPPAQLGWDLSLSRMVNGGMFTCVCIWCNSQFHHFGPVDGPQTGSFGFICPTCKDRMSGRNMPNHGSWQP
ncbi:uncharacterized protein LOC133895385 isoform X2 [Phragmites australis]|uniref:uncharacterized protein LOC133895385 isoform X2 n=1 Tax=Phragmites australis TaxID=29695 RepID=UPI002D7957B8|nr:uncharacterized protein LOC133895385 isoform X2 [Phragmites australis]